MYVLKNKLYTVAVFIIDAIGYALTFLPRIFKRVKFPSDVKNILVIRLDHLGDLISSACIPENLKHKYPNAKIDFLAPSWAGDILKNNPYIDRVIYYDAPWFNRGSKELIRPGSFFRLAKELRKAGYDLGLDLRGDIRHILLMALGGVKFRVGYGITGGGFLLQRKAVYRKGMSAVEKNLDLLRAMGITPFACESKLYASTEDEQAAEVILKEYGLIENDLIAAIHPFAGYSSKNWQEEKFAQLIGGLYKKYAAKVILIGSEKDRGANDNIIRMSNVAAINLAAKTPLGVLYALLKRVSLFIGVDSGPSHIAAAAQRPTVVLYSGTNNPSEWLPSNNNTVIVKKDIPCANCQKLNCSQHLCMDLITVEDVMAALKQVLKR